VCEVLCVWFCVCVCGCVWLCVCVCVGVCLFVCVGGWVYGNLKSWEPSQHLLLEKGIPSKTCVEVAGRRTFRILTSSQQSGI